MENPVDPSAGRARRASAKHPRRDAFAFAWPIAALLHGAALAAAAFIQIDVPVRAREYASDDEVILMLDLRASSLYDFGGTEEELDGVPGDADEPELAPEAAPTDLALAQGTEIGHVLSIESEVEPPDTEIVDAAPPAPTWPEDEPLADIAIPQVVAPDVVSVAGSQPAEAPVATTERASTALETTTAASDAAGSSNDGTPASARDANATTGAGSRAGGGIDGGNGNGVQSGTGDGDVGLGGGGDVASVSSGELRARFAPRPSYPERARRRGEQGSVLCRLIVDRDGRVVEVSIVVSSSFPDLDAAAVATLRRWRFEPIGRLTSASRARALQKLTFALASARS